MNETNNKSEKMRILKQFIEREISQSDDKYEISVAQMQVIFENAIKAIEEVSGKEIDLDKFNEFLQYYKIMKVVEKVTEELRVENYLKDMKGIK